MAVKATQDERPRTVGYVSREATVAVEQRVKEILARREVALRQARLAARRLDRP
jgi:hypothetical protein